MQTNVPYRKEGSKAVYVDTDEGTFSFATGAEAARFASRNRHLPRRHDGRPVKVVRY